MLLMFTEIRLLTGCYTEVHPSLAGGNQKMWIASGIQRVFIQNDEAMEVPQNHILPCIIIFLQIK